MIFVDTNYFLRFLLADVGHEHNTARKLFQDGASGAQKLFSSTIVVFEIYWVLASFYQKEKQELVAILNGILAMGFVKLGERQVIKDALELFARESIDFEDAYNATYARAHGATGFATFDKKLRAIT